MNRHTAFARVPRGIAFLPSPLGASSDLAGVVGLPSRLLGRTSEHAGLLPSPSGGGAGGEGVFQSTPEINHPRPLTPTLSQSKREQGAWRTALLLALLAFTPAYAQEPAQTFATEAATLVPAVQVLCDAPTPEPSLGQARQRWVAALVAWERLSAVALGPVLERRSQRQIDFSPTRPRLIEKAVKSAPRTPADMELIGTPAKGFPALEWLLWTRPVQPGSPECAYAVQLAGEIQREATALAAQPGAVPALVDRINQWVGGIERLRWAQMELPLRAALTGGKDSIPDYPRRASGATAAVWAAQWAALKAEALGPLTAALATKQLPNAALVQAVAQADAAMAGLDTRDNPRILAAARTLADLKRLVEDQVAPALGVSIGFSDADGD